MGLSGVDAGAAGIIPSSPNTSFASTNVVEKEAVVSIRSFQKLLL